MDIKETVFRIVSAMLCTVTDVLARTTTLKEDLGADSLDMLEIAMFADDEFNIQLKENIEEKWETVQDIIDSVSLCKITQSSL
jgi:acyl carrier protein